MSRRGATDYAVGKPTIMIETVYDDGSSSFKLFPTIKGFKMSLSALKIEISASARFANGTVPWVPVDHKIHVTSPSWTQVKEADVEVLATMTDKEIEEEVDRIRDLYV